MNIKIKEGIQFRELGDENLLYDYENKKVHVINSSALDVFKYCQEEKTFDEIVTIFVDKYEIDKDIIQNDITEILDMFQKLNLFSESK